MNEASITPSAPVGRRVLFLGAGNMGGAVLAAALGSGVLDSDRVAVCDQAAADRFGTRVACFDGSAQAASWLFAGGLGRVPLLVLGVKPQVLVEPGGVAETWRPLLAAAPAAAASMLAGTPSTVIRRVLSPAAGVLRFMPNTPAAIGAGCTAVASDADVVSEIRDDLLRVLRASGTVFEMPEDRLDAFTAVAGSGPAYVFYLAEAMQAAARDLDLPDAHGIVRATVLGSARLLASTAESPRELRSRVTSRRGTTQAATDVLDERLIHDAFVDAIRRARARATELANEAGGTPPSS
ncbi:MAG: pyrroline-5-carboxylate reductase dimerization domain-containing protein [Planctomycetota bacterium]